MLRVLIITYYWPPTGGSGVQRWVKFSKYLPEFGVQPVIYTPENPERQSVDHSLENDIRDDVKVIKRPITEFYSIYRFLSGKKSQAGGGDVNPINGQKKSLLQKIFLAIRGNLFVPDPRITWVRPSVRFLKKYLEENPVDVIVSTGPPHSMHLIAKEVSKAMDIPWVADFRDPWTKIFYFKHLPMLPFIKRKHDRLEKMILDSADRVVAVTSLVQEDLMSMTDTPVELITNGYDESDFEQIVEPDKYFNVTHTGLFANDGNPDMLWKVLADNCKENEEFDKLLRIRLVGKTDKEIIDSIRKHGLYEKLVDLGYQSHQVAVREQKNATVLILPLRKEPEYKQVLPGKLFEYLASLRPILGIGDTDGAMSSVINDARAGVVADWNDEAKIDSFIERAWMRFKGGNEDNSVENIEQYSRKALSEKMARLLKSLVENKNHEKESE